MDSVWYWFWDTSETFSENQLNWSCECDRSHYGMYGNVSFLFKMLETEWGSESGSECFHDPINRFGYQLLCGVWHPKRIFRNSIFKIYFGLCKVRAIWLSKSIEISWKSLQEPMVSITILMLFDSQIDPTLHRPKKDQEIQVCKILLGSHFPHSNW